MAWISTVRQAVLEGDRQSPIGVRLTGLVGQQRRADWQARSRSPRSDWSFASHTHDLASVGSSRSLRRSKSRPRRTAPVPAAPVRGLDVPHQRLGLTSPPTGSGGLIRHNPRGGREAAKIGVVSRVLGLECVCRLVVPGGLVKLSTVLEHMADQAVRRCPARIPSQGLLVTCHGLVEPPPKADDITEVVESIGEAWRECQCTAACRLGFVQEVRIPLLAKGLCQVC